MPFTFKEASTGGNQYTETEFGVQKAHIKAVGDNIELVYKLKVLDGERKGEELEVTQRLFKNEDGSLSHPTYKGYTNKAGVEKAASTTYDVLNAARELGDDRFTKSLDTNAKDEIETLKGLKFKMGYKHVVASSGSEYDFLNTSYRQLKDKQDAAEYAKTQAGADLQASTPAVDGDDLPF